MKKDNTSKIIYIEWADAHTNTAWFDKEEAELWAENTDWIIKEVGWLVKETKDYVCIAEALKPENDLEEGQYLNLHKIPKPWVVKRKFLKL